MIQQQAVSDSLRPVLDSIFAQPRYHWADTPELLGWLGRAWRWLIEGLEQFRSASPVAYRWFVAGLLVVLGLFLIHSLWLMWRMAGASRLPRPEGTGESVERRDAAWYRDEAEACAGEARYREALICAWHSLALRLDERGVIRYHRSRTPNEFVEEARLDPHDKEELRALVARLYRSLFGAELCGPEDYQSWAAAARELERAV